MLKWASINSFPSFTTQHRTWRLILTTTPMEIVLNPPTQVIWIYMLTLSAIRNPSYGDLFVFRLNSEVYLPNNILSILPRICIRKKCVRLQLNTFSNRGRLLGFALTLLRTLYILFQEMSDLMVDIEIYCHCTG